jgi:hypothetical protein
VSLGVSVAGCGSTPHVSRENLRNAYIAPFLDLARGDAKRFCADFTPPVAHRLAIEIQQRSRAASRHDCDTTMAHVLKLTGEGSSSLPATAGLLRNIEIRDIHAHGRAATARVGLSPGTLRGGTQIRFGFADGRWRIAQVPGFYLGLTRPRSSPPAESGVFSMYF